MFITKYLQVFRKGKHLFNGFVFRADKERGNSPDSIGLAKTEEIVEGFEDVFGVLLSSGQTLDSILDMSFDQIELAAKCIYKHKMDMINMVQNLIYMM